MSIPSPAVEFARSVSIVGSASCACGHITVRLHNEDGEIFAAFQMPAEAGRAFVAAYQIEIDRADAAGPLTGIRCEGSA